MVDFNNVFIMGDQPQTCPKCGNRTEIIVEFVQGQIHRCLGDSCNFTFVVEENETRSETLDT